MDENRAVNIMHRGVPKVTMEEVDRYHRKQLRQILKIKWSDKMSNTQLYDKANVKPLSYRIIKARWKMTGRVLRQNEQNPARTAILFALRSEKPIKVDEEDQGLTYLVK